MAPQEWHRADHWCPHVPADVWTHIQTQHLKIVWPEAGSPMGRVWNYVWLLHWTGSVCGAQSGFADPVAHCRAICMLEFGLCCLGKRHLCEGCISVYELYIRHSHWQSTGLDRHLHTKTLWLALRWLATVFFRQVCSRDGSTLRKRTLSLSQRGKNKKGIFSSLKGLDTLARKGKEKRASITQVSSWHGRNRRLGEILDTPIWRPLQVISVYLLVKVNSVLIQKNLGSPGTCTHVNYTNGFVCFSLKGGLRNTGTRILRIGLGTWPSWWSACLACLKLHIWSSSLHTQEHLCTGVKPALDKLRKEYQEFKGMSVSLRSAWTRNPDSKRRKRSRTWGLSVIQ